jgi:DNA-binding NtrC family response regulator
MENSAVPVLLIDDEEQILLSYSLMLRSAGIEHVLTVQDSREVMPLLSEHNIAVIVLDLIMPYISGNKLLTQIRSEFPQIPIIVMTATNELDIAVECMKEGAFDYLVKPVEKSKFVSTVKKALELITLRNELSSLKYHLLTDRLEHEEAFSSFITKSKKMISIFHYIEAISKTQNPIYIYGETGVGKELLARSIYKISGLKGEFVAVNVAGLDDTMFSDTLFGHRKGAYTGADRDRDGLIVKASGGILLLDEIGDLNEFSQLKLLRLLDEKRYYPLGSDVPEKTDARIIATTNKDLKKQISTGKFRKDLYYRLCAHSVHIPPLRERREDIPLLFEHFLQCAANSFDKKKPPYPEELIKLLSSYHFPGNVRELQAMVFDAVAQHKSGMLSLKSFKEFMKQKGESTEPDLMPLVENKNSNPSISGRFPTLKESEEFLISEALRRSNGNQSIAASLLGISRQALNKRLKRAQKKC